MAGPCAFCGVAQGALPAARVWEDAQTLVFLDHRPLFPGHCLVVPKDHVPTLLELPPERVGGLFGVAQRVARALEAALGCQGSFVAVNNRVSQSVPHLHVHVVPRTRGDGLKGFFWPRTPYRDAEHLEQTRARLAAALGDASR